MRILQTYPIIKIFSAFLLGVLAWGLLQIYFFPSIIFSVVSVLMLTVFHLFYKQIFAGYTRQWIFGFLLLAVFFILGMQMSRMSNKPLSNNHFSKYVIENEVIVAKIVEQPQPKENTIKLILQPLQLINDSITQNIEGNLIAYIKKDSTSSLLKYPNIIAFKSKIQEVEKTKNPHQFDYKSYLASKNIFHQVFIPESGWEKIGEGRGNPLLILSYSLRNLFVDVFRNNGLSGDEFAVSTALILGYDDKLSYELSSKFAHAGAMHVLCVSGLHVGVIFLIVSSLLTPLRKLKYGKLINASILILAIWFFALITGMSSSVMRAATMFSFVAIGDVLNRKNNIYNTLALSAFLLLLINPKLIYDLGFKLSYSAVIGIVAIQPHLYKKWKPKWWIIDKAWAIVCVSIAAQIATLPLTLYYFHQFPNYFVISNLVVIPAASVIIYLGVLVLLTSPFSLISGILTKLLGYTVYYLNYSVDLIDELPFSFTEGIVVNQFQVLLIVLSILCFYWFFYKKKSFFMYCGFFAIIAIATISTVRKIAHYNQKKIVIYNIRKSTAIDLVTGQRSLFLADSLTVNNDKLIDYNVRNNRWYSDITNISSFKIDSCSFRSQENFCMKENNILKFHDKLIAQITPTNSNIVNGSNISIDILLVSNNSKLVSEEVLVSYKPKKVVFDSSNGNWSIQEWIDACVKHKIPYYSILEEGAFVMEL